MTVATAIGLAGHGDAEQVAGVARRAGSSTAIGIDAPDASVRPARRRQGPSWHDLHGSAVALLTAHHRSGQALDLLAQDVVQGIEDVTALRVSARGELFRLADVTSGAVLWGYQNADRVAVMVHRVWLSLLSLVTLVTADLPRGVNAALPFDDLGCHKLVGAMTRYAVRGGLGEHDRRRDISGR